MKVRDPETSQQAGFYAAGGTLEPADIELKVYGFTTFQVLKPFVYVDRQNEVWPIPPNEGTDTTDLASVPQLLWGLVASYGRQLAPALMHDYYCELANKRRQQAGGDQKEIDAAYADRRATDLRFREALRVEKMAWYRSNVFWAAVTFDRYKSFKLPAAVLFVLQAVAVAVGVIWAGALWLSHWAHPHHSGALSHPSSWLIVAGGGLAVSVVYGWNSMLAVASGCLAAPIVVVELLVTLVMAVCLLIPDLLITVVGKLFTLGRANLHWPAIRPTRLKF